MLRGHLLTAAQVLLLMLVKVYDARCETVFLFSMNYQSKGLITERLTTKDLEKWKEIERVVFAEDINLQPLHPTLMHLWEWIETSGHTVYVEFVNTRSAPSCNAGHFTIERFDPSGESHIAIIRLNLTNINQAYIGPETKRMDGFIPFLGLEREERYAEVLGHELAHAVHILTSLERTHMVEEVVQKTNQMLLSQHSRYSKSGSVTPELGHLLSKRDAVLQELEAQAEAMEKVIWNELIARKPERAKQFSSGIRP